MSPSNELEIVRGLVRGVRHGMKRIASIMTVCYSVISNIGCSIQGNVNDMTTDLR